MIPYQFAQLFYLHDASSHEIATIGIVMWIPTSRKLLTFINIHHGRLSAFWPDLNRYGYGQMVKYLRAHFEQMSKDVQAAQEKLFRESANGVGFISLLNSLIIDGGSCFRWSPIMAGLAPDVDVRFAQLKNELIERYENRGPRKRNDENMIWNKMEACFSEHRIIGQMQKDILIDGKNYAYKFKCGWQNGVKQVIEPISFDYLDDSGIVDKANTWSGRLLSLSRNTSKQFQMIGVLSSPPAANSGLQDAYKKANDILASAPNVRMVLAENQVGTIVPTIRQEISNATVAK